jgi:hypothetical protein
MGGSAVQWVWRVGESVVGRADHHLIMISCLVWSSGNYSHKRRCNTALLGRKRTIAAGFSLGRASVGVCV